MIDNLTKYAGLIPLIAIVIYVLGYISLTAYLQSYNIDENIGLDFKTLKLGILLSIAVAPIIFFAFSTFKVGDYENAKVEMSESLATTLHDALGYSIIYSLTLATVFFKHKFDPPTNTMLGIFVVATILNKIQIKPNVSKVLKSCFILLPFFILCFIILKDPAEGKSVFYFTQIMVFTACATYRIFNKEGITYQFSKIGMIIITMFSTGSMFGWYVVEHIPLEYGGEKKITKTFFINDTELDKVKQTSLFPYLKKGNMLTLPVLFDSGEAYYFKVPGKTVVSIPKTYIGATQNAITGK